MDYNEWLQLPETVAMKKGLVERAQDRKEAWAAGCYTTETTDGTVQKNAEAIGYVSACEDLIDYLTEKEDEVESEGVQGSY